jgi:hypothetical protein
MSFVSYVPSLPTVSSGVPVLNKNLDSEPIWLQKYYKGEEILEEDLDLDNVDITSEVDEAEDLRLFYEQFDDLEHVYDDDDGYDSLMGDLNKEIDEINDLMDLMEYLAMDSSEA